jgi:hypothetical protein
MNDPGRARPDDHAPLVLRKVPPERQRLARAMTEPGRDEAGDIWWELVDAAAAADHAPAGVVLTCAGPEDCVTVSALGVRHPGGADEYAELLRALMAALRSRSAETVIANGADPVVERALIDVGFTRTPDRGDGDRYRIVL